MGKESRMRDQIAERLAYRPDEAARALGCSRDLIFKLLASGELKTAFAFVVAQLPEQGRS